MLADLCHVVLACFRGENAKMRHAKICQMVSFSCFRMATFRPATRKYATFYALRFRHCLSFLCLAGRKVAMRKAAKIAFSPRKHSYTTWYKSATIPSEYDYFTNKRIWNTYILPTIKSELLK